MGATGWLLGGLKICGAAIVFAIAALTFVDVIGRYAFSRPIPGTYEIVGLLLGIAVFSGLPLVSYDRAHITVDLFDGLFRGRVRRVQQFLVLLASAVIVGFIAERLLMAGLDEAANDFVTEDLGISRAPLIYLLAALGAFTSALLFAMSWRFLTGRLAVKQPMGHGDL